MKVPKFGRSTETKNSKNAKNNAVKITSADFEITGAVDNENMQPNFQEEYFTMNERVPQPGQWGYVAPS